MDREKAFFILLTLSAGCLLCAAGAYAQLIEPTRSLTGSSDGAGLLNVLSEPPGMQVQVDGNIIGKTPIFSAPLPPGPHMVRIRDSQTEVHLTAGKTTSISWFKGAFIEIPETAKPSAEVPQEAQPPPSKPKADKGRDARRDTEKDPYYWPLNPRGPIY